MTSKTARSIGGGGGTWLVLSRDISDSVRIDGEPHVRAGIVLDVGTGLVRGVAAGKTEVDAVAQAVEMSLTQPAGGLPPGRPEEVLCALGREAQIIEILSSLIGMLVPGAARSTPVSSWKTTSHPSAAFQNSATANGSTAAMFTLAMRLVTVQSYGNLES